MPGKLPWLSGLMDKAEEEVLADMTFPDRQRATLHIKKPVARQNGKITLGTDVLWSLPNEAETRKHRVTFPSRRLKARKPDGQVA